MPCILAVVPDIGLRRLLRLEESIRLVNQGVNLPHQPHAGPELAATKRHQLVTSHCSSCLLSYRLAVSSSNCHLGLHASSRALTSGPHQAPRLESTSHHAPRQRTGDNQTA